MAIFDYKYNDFTGFTFNGRHSSEFKVLRTNDGSDRYQDSLIPAISDTSEEVPGGMGEYYYGSSYGSREFEINIAYDELNEKDKRLLKKWLYPDHSLHELIFDERPYIKYWVKLSSAPEFSELCFDNSITGQRVYKGEANLKFTAYMPFGIVVDKNLESEVYEKYKNIDQWAGASGLVNKDEVSSTLRANLDVFKLKDNKWKSLVYNPGDVETDFTLNFEHKVNQVILTDVDPYNTINAPGSTTSEYAYEMADEIDTKYSYKIFINNVGEPVSYSDSAWADTYKRTYTTSGGYFVEVSTGKAYQAYLKKEGAGCRKFTSTSDISKIKKNSLIVPNNGSGEIYYVVDTIKKSDGKIELILFFSNWRQKGAPSETPYYDNLSVGEIVADAYDISLYDGDTLAGEFSIEFPRTIGEDVQDMGLLGTISTHDSKIRIDTRKQTVEFCYNTSGQLYSDWQGISGLITKGDLFKIPQSDFQSITQSIVITPKASQLNQIEKPTIEYTYLYR